ncbi:MAG TPA: response regulator [Steroidobacteraceae bacterium]|nr:response regulator [Steroidobacteraceae bacterium]
MTLASRLVLLIEDDAQIRHVVRTLLQLEQLGVVEAADGASGLAAARNHKWDLLIIDLGLPDSDGLQIIEQVRRWSAMPIIVLSARSAEADKVAALELGADDYLSKPFGARELVARVRVALRHAGNRGGHGALVQIGPWRIDLTARRTQDAAGGSLHLTRTEYRLLEVLHQRLGLVVTHRALLQQVWGPGSAERIAYLRVYMRQLRSKLEPDPTRPRWLLTDTAVGYRLVQGEAGPSESE